ncbi:MAG TPA: Rpn family recombination-promoting nuclease/putative transposase [Thermoanaerobaculia bacterium]|nr:Rpn family recombination-promoting nuclease/putative transposase [Thermoanaerobaculia bacterium]
MKTRDRTPRRRKTEHDRSYKRLFSHPAAVEELLRGFLREEWVERLDFSTLERVSGSFVSDKLRERHTDLIWRLRLTDGEGGFFLYVLLELQSTPDPFMAVRLMSYAGLLFEAIVRQEKLKGGDLLPAVLSIVLYNGKRPWNGPRDLASFFPPAPPGLQRRLPDFSYVLLDESRLDLDRPELAGNRVATLFQIERCDLAEIPHLVRQLRTLTKGEDPGLWRTFLIWIGSVLRRTSRGSIIASAIDLAEEESMLEDNIRAWERKVRGEGKREGKREGEVKALRDVLLSQMALRFGRIPRQVRGKIREISSAPELRKLAERLITADSLQDLRIV